MTKNEARTQALADVANHLIAAFPDEVLQGGKRLTKDQARMLNTAITIVKYLD